MMVGGIGLIIFAYRAPWTWKVSSVGQIWRLLGLVYVPGKVSGTAINALIKRVWMCFTMQIIPATFPGLGIIAWFGK